MYRKVKWLVGIWLIASFASAGVIAPDLKARLSSAGEDEKIPVIVVLKTQVPPRAFSQQPSALILSLRQTAETTQRDLLSLLQSAKESAEAEKIKSFWIVNAVALRATRGLIEAIAGREDVDVVELDRVVQLPPVRQGAPIAPLQANEWNIDKIRAPEVWAKGITGKGVLVGIIDSGVDVTHPDLAGKWRATNAWFDATDEASPTPVDPDGHGTHCIGTILGGSAGGTHIGVAPDAKFIAARGLDASGFGMVSWLVACMQWMLDPDGNPTTNDFPVVVNNSWGSVSYYEASEWIAVQRWRDAGIFPSFAIGNEGPNPMTTDSPGDYPHAFAVGATDVNDMIADFSSRGPVAWGGVTYTKPDVSAPGVAIKSSIPGGGYAVYDGTSMATPHVTGLVALLKEANPRLSVSDIENIIKSTAVPLGTGIPNNDYGWGRIDAAEAVNKSAFLILSGGQRTPSQGTPSTLFTFSVIYDNPQGIPAQYVKLHLTNRTTSKTYDYDMTSTDNRLYRVRTYLEKGLYDFYFTAYDGSTELRYPLAGDIVGLKVNTPPLLTGGTVTPQVDKPGGTFTYEVEYSDPDIDQAQYVNLHISQDGAEITGSPFTMTSKDGKTWTYSLQLFKTTGYKHSFYFSASDGIDEVSTAAVEGPILNNPPQLLNPTATPSFGQVGDKFSFSIKYKDADGDTPQNFRFHLIDSQGREIPVPPPEQEGTDPKAGIIFWVKDVTLSSQGTYSFWGEVDDGYPNGKTQSPKGSVGVGVIGVQATPGELDIFAQRDGKITIGISYKPNETVALTLTNPAGKVFSAEVTTEQNGLAQYTLPTYSIPLDVLGIWKVEAKDKATGGSKGSISFLLKGSYQFPASLDMISLPLGFANTKLSDIFKDQLTNLMSKWWSAAQGQYVDLSTLNTGMGFWMKTKDGKPPSLVIYSGSLLSGEAAVGLTRGWNIVGSPLLSEMDIAALQFQYGGQKVSLETAVDKGWIRGYLWGYDTATGDYILIHPALTGDNRTIKAWKGYWLKTLADGVQLVFTPGIQATVQRGAAKPEGWLVQLVVESAQGRDACNYIGLGDSRFYSGVENPPAKGGIDLYILRKGRS